MYPHVRTILIGLHIAQHARPTVFARAPCRSLWRLCLCLVLLDAGLHDLQCTLPLPTFANAIYSSELSKAYLILAVVLGASIGHFVFGAQMDVDSVLAGAAANKGMACH